MQGEIFAVKPLYLELCLKFGIGNSVGEPHCSEFGFQFQVRCVTSVTIEERDLAMANAYRSTTLSI